MKRVEELGISPWPWSCENDMVGDANHNSVCGNGWHPDSEDARLIAAAPELYDACQRVIAWEDAVNQRKDPPERWRETSKEWNYRECSAPHCGNCKHFERIYEDCYCRLQDALEDDYNYANIYPDEGGVCDKWEAAK